MTPLEKTLVHLYSFMLGIYPRSFRDNFKDEMVDVFGALMRDAMRRSVFSMCTIFIREIIVIPFTAGKEHLLSLSNRLKLTERTHPNPIPFANRRFRMTVENNDRFTMEDRRTTVLSAIPPMLIGLSISITWFIIRGPWYTSSESTRKLAILIGSIPVILIVIGCIWALLKKLPAWSATWLGTAITGTALVIQSLAEDLTFFSGLYGYILIAVFGIISLVIVIAIALRNTQQAGLLGIGLSSVITLFQCHVLSVGPTHHFWIGMAAILPGLLFSTTAYFFLRTTQMKDQGIILLGTAILNISGVWLSANIYSPYLVQQGKNSFAFPLAVIVCIALVSGLLVQLARSTYLKILTKH
jgi:hypothetical protein